MAAVLKYVVRVSAGVLLALLSLVAFPTVSSALQSCEQGQSCPTGTVCEGGICQARLENGPQGAADVLRVFDKVGNWLFLMFMVLSVFLLIWAAFLFVTGGGDPAKLKEAKQRVLYAIIGIALALLAGFFPSLIADILRVR